MKEKINVMLYGNTATTKSAAKITMCDRKDVCSFYKKGQCFCIPRTLSGYCKFGECDTHVGYTSRSSKAYAFEKKYEQDPYYRALERPIDWYVGVLGDTVVFNLVYASCEKNEWNTLVREWRDSDVYLMNQQRSTNFYTYIPLVDLTPDLLHLILTYEPKTKMGRYETIADYTDRIVPHTLFDISKLLPEVYAAFIEKYPEFKSMVPDFRGRKAKVSSLVDGVNLPTNNGVFVKNGDYLMSDAYRPAFLAFGAESCEAKIKITDKMVYEITDNSQVDDDTEFV